MQTKLRPRRSRDFPRFRAATAMLGLLALSASAVAAADGAQIFSTRCAGCHQADGRGVEGRFPPLKNDLAIWLATPGGRAYLTEAVLFGPVGAIQVEGKTYDSIMPGAGRRMNDDDLIAVLRYVAETLNTPPAGYQPFNAALVDSLRNSATAENSMPADRARLPLR